MKKPVAKAAGFFYVRRPGKRAINRPVTSLVQAGVRDADRAWCSRSPDTDTGPGASRTDWYRPSRRPKRRRAPLPGPCLVRLVWRFMGFEEGMKKEGSL